MITDLPINQPQGISDLLGSRDRSKPEAAESPKKGTFSYSVRRRYASPSDPRVYQRNRIICNTDYSAEVDLFRMLSTQMLNWLQERNGHAVAITSCGKGEGKTLISTNLAVCLAKNSGYETVLVDSDLRRPNVAKRFGLEIDRGLDDVLAGTTSLDTCLLATEIDGLFILPTKAALNPSSPLLSTARLNKLAGDIQAMNRGRLVIYDLPPLLLGDSCAPFIASADGCLLVVAEGQTTTTRLERGLSLISEKKLIGVTLNKASGRLAEQEGYISYDYYSEGD